MSTISRGVLCGIAFVLVAPWAAAQEPESDAPGTAAGGRDRRITVTLEAKGELHGPAVGRDDPVRQPISMQASFDYVEAPAAGDRDLAAVRRYREANATIGLDGSQQTITLPPDARSILVARLGTTPVPYLQDAYLSRDELELLEIPFDSLLLDQVLPDRPVSETEQWQVAGDLTAGMLAIDTVETGGLVARVSALDDGVASVVVEGTVDGAVDGVPTHVIVSGSFTVAAEPDEDGYLLTGGARRLDVVMREFRQASHVAAGFEIEARLAMRADEPGGDVGAASHGDADAPVAGTRRRGSGGPGVIWYRDPEGRYDLIHESGWRCVEEDAGGVVLRLLDLGALVAQCSITALPRAEEAARPTLDEVRRHVERSLSGQFQRFGESSETTREADGARVIRVVSEGTAEDLPFRWVHYVVTDDDGHRVHATFMYEASLERRFSAADTRVIDGLRLAPEARREAGLPRKTEVP